HGSYLPLVIEHIGAGPRGLPLVSVAHYGEQHGDAMRDPEMVFEVDVQAVTDAAATEAAGALVAAWGWDPGRYLNDYAGVHQEAVWRDDADGDQLHTNLRLVRDLEAFARTWDRNLAAQGFASVAAAHDRVRTA